MHDIVPASMSMSPMCPMCLYSKIEFARHQNTCLDVFRTAPAHRIASRRELNSIEAFDPALSPLELLQSKVEHSVPKCSECHQNSGLVSKVDSRRGAVLR